MPAAVSLPGVHRWLLMAGLVAAGFSWGLVVHRNQVFPYALLKRIATRLRPRPTLQVWQPHRARGPAVDEGVSQLPYLKGYVPSTGGRGVTRSVRGLVQPGLNLVVSAHAPGAQLLDMQGRVLHAWSCPGAEYWIQAKLLPDGGIAAVQDDGSLVRLAKDSTRLWRADGGYHHEIELTRDGSVWALARRDRVALGRAEPVFEDFVVQLAADGRVLREVSLLVSLQRSKYAPLVGHLPADPDILHTNSLRLLREDDERLPAFRAGRFLVSFPMIDTVAVVDVDASRVVWALAGLFRLQHSAVPLGNGRLLLFDNRWTPTVSRALELDALTHEVTWQYPRGSEAEVFSRCCGWVQRLENGNTLVTESTNGRAVEVTREGEVVWEYVNPARSGEGDMLIATLFKVERVAAPWAESDDEPREVGAGRAHTGGFRSGDDGVDDRRQSP